MATILSEEEFDQRFTIVPDAAGDNIRSTMPAASSYNPRTLWTALDCDGDIHLVPGPAFVNRIGYVLTEEAWSADIESAAYDVRSEESDPDDKED